MNDAEQANQKLWDELAPVHIQAYRAVQLLRNGGHARTMNLGVQIINARIDEGTP